MTTPRVTCMVGLLNDWIMSQLKEALVSLSIASTSITLFSTQNDRLLCKITSKSGQPRPDFLQQCYLSPTSSEIGATSQQGTSLLPPMSMLFRGFTVF